MKNLLIRLTIAAVAAVVLGIVAPASIKADPVHFVTGGAIAGAFVTVAPIAGAGGAGGVAGTSTIATIGGLTITFNGLVATACPLCPNSIPPTNVDLGNFVVTAPAALTAFGPTAFTLTVIQDTPGPTSSGGTTATMQGLISMTQGGIDVTFTSGAFTINGITYTLLLQPGNILSLNNQSTNAGITNLQARISGSAIPEPATLFLLGTGLAGLAGAVRRRFKNPS